MLRILYYCDEEEKLECLATIEKDTKLWFRPHYVGEDLFGFNVYAEDNLIDTMDTEEEAISLIFLIRMNFWAGAEYFEIMGGI